MAHLNKNREQARAENEQQMRPSTGKKTAKKGTAKKATKVSNQLAYASANEALEMTQLCDPPTRLQETTLSFGS